MVVSLLFATLLLSTSAVLPAYAAGEPQPENVVIVGPGYRVVASNNHTDTSHKSRDSGVEPLFTSFNYAATLDAPTQSYPDSVTQGIFSGFIESASSMTQRYAAGFGWQTVDLNGSHRGWWNVPNPQYPDSISLTPSERVEFNGGSFSVSAPGSVSISYASTSATFTWPTQTWSGYREVTYYWSGVHADASGFTQISRTNAIDQAVFRYGSNAYGLTSQIQVNWSYP